MIRPWVANTLILLAATAWFINFVLGAVRSDYVINESVNSVFLAIITGVVAARLHSGDKVEKDGGEETPEEPAREDRPGDPAERDDHGL